MAHSLRISSPGSKLPLSIGFGADERGTVPVRKAMQQRDHSAPGSYRLFKPDCLLLLSRAMILIQPFIFRDAICFVGLVDREYKHQSMARARDSCKQIDVIYAVDIFEYKRL